VEDVPTTRKLLSQILSEVALADGSAALDRFPSLRHVDAKVREVKTILKPISGAIGSLYADFEADDDFQANSRRVRLEALANYCRSALKFLDHGGGKFEKAVTPCPSIARLTKAVPALEGILQARWIEAQRCQNGGAYLAAVIMMGSILEGLLLAAASDNRPACYKASHAPKKREGGVAAVEEWKLTHLIDVAVELGWIKTDRGKFSHALRESRNVVHPWEHMATRADFDQSTCKTCWHVLNASVDDLLQCVP
jgi:hypothetical protein